MHMIFVGVPR